ncbi:hypothetical protein [Ruegeria sp. EL01]|jgi:hypothetical protein|uniref:hypothetical protein n=1 Tax=Ruegeria sp. EL01 TaxID=2107578 RepID=UPI000EA8278C|nr:hypothetical protein [Ruegeria sp. EL01]
MTTRTKKVDPETLHQWDVIETKRQQLNADKKELSLLAGRQDSYYYQSHKFKRPIPLEALVAWSEALNIPSGMLFLDGEEDPKAKIMNLVEQADKSKLPQAVRILEAFLIS